MEAAGLPVKMYQSAERLTVAAPMPGLEPPDITVRVTAEGALELRGKRRGPRQDDMDLLLDEWSVGPYERTLSLPCHVDGELADVTYGNGVVVVALPKAAQTRPATLSLEAIGLARGQRVGSHGKDLAPTTTEEHRKAKANMAAMRHSAR
jgi:HSP20 family protein